MRVLVFIDHDILCRHFILSGAFSRLIEAADVHFVFPDDGGRRVSLDLAQLPLGAPYERLTIDPQRQQFWKWLLYADQLRPRRGAHESAIRRIRWSTLGWKAASLLTVAGLPIVEPLWRRRMHRHIARRPNVGLEALIVREKPDVIFHPSVLEGVFINDLVEASSKHRIPLVVTMNSWDNPSTKRAVVGQPDRLLVWGEQTREHAMRFMGMARSRVIPFGAAQFDVFRKPPRCGRDDYARSLGLTPDNRIVLFAGSNARTDEVATLQTLDAAISDGRIRDTSIVYRPHPWGGGGHGGHRLASMAFRNIVIDPTMANYIASLGAARSGMTLPDYRDTHDLLSVVDAVVSPMSTILFEAILHAKPVVVHTPASARTAGPVIAGMPMLHFEQFLALPDVAVAQTDEELICEINRFSDQTETAARGARLHDAAEHFLQPFEQPWCERIVTLLKDVTNASAGGERQVKDLVA